MQHITNHNLSYEQRTKPITSAKGRGWNRHRFICVPHRSWGFNVCNKIRQTCVSKVIIFCVTPIVPESFMIVSSINVLVWLFQNVGGFGRRSYHYSLLFRPSLQRCYHTCVESQLWLCSPGARKKKKEQEKMDFIGFHKKCRYSICNGHASICNGYDGFGYWCICSSLWSA